MSPLHWHSIGVVYVVLPQTTDQEEGWCIITSHDSCMLRYSQNICHVTCMYSVRELNVSIVCDLQLHHFRLLAHIADTMATSLVIYIAEITDITCGVLSCCQSPLQWSILLFDFQTCTSCQDLNCE